MAKCLKCGEIINTLYDEDELCDSCDSEVLNISTETEKELENLNIEKKYSKKNNYTLWNMLIIPFLYSCISGLCQGGNLFLDFPDTITTGWTPLFFLYYLPKIFFLFLNRYTKSKWEWPYSLSYFILPIITMLFQLYVSN
jgi:hypothetical protein